MSRSPRKFSTGPNIDAYIDRRMHLLKNTPPCPVCIVKSRIRLEEYLFVRPATWRCLDCNYGFGYEPKE